MCSLKVFVRGVTCFSEVFVKGVCKRCLFKMFVRGFLKKAFVRGVC